MKLAALLSLLVAGALGCSGPQPARGREVAPALATTEVQARVIAERHSRESGHDLSRHRIVSVTYEREGHFKGHWAVNFEHTPPVPPGGHFTVYVNASSGAARLLLGE